MIHDNYKYIIGIDEVGRGPLAGSVVVGAFCVTVKDSEKVLSLLHGITDSKKISEKKREIYTVKIKELQDQGLVNVVISAVSARSIDNNGIVPSIQSAVNSCLEKLNLNPDEAFVYLDGGLHAPADYDQETVIKGDSKIWQIGAASIVAKVLRDKKMIEYGKKYPEYGFESHKGYGTQKHRDAIKEFGIIDIHRRTWIHT